MSSHDLTSVPATDPVGIYRVRDALYAPDMLLTALVHLDLFSWLDRQPATRAEVCRALDIVDRPADVMLTLFAAMGLVEERQGSFTSPRWRANISSADRRGFSGRTFRR